MAEEKKKAAPVKNTNAVKKEEKKLGFFQRIGKWFRELKSELKKVVLWGFDELAGLVVNVIFELAG